MSASPDVIHTRSIAEIGKGWNAMPSVRKDGGKGSSCTRLMSGESSSSGDECNAKVRKPYTITKQRERWTENEHQKFLEALKLYGRAWRRIEEYIGTKTAVQIRSHAQKFFSKLEREASIGSQAGKVQDIEIPPPRPKRKPSHPYPRKAANSPLNLEDENKEPSGLSAAGRTEGHHAGFQSGSFNPYISRGLGPDSSAFHRTPLVPGHLFGPQGSVKLFGKTVIVPENLKQHDHSGKERLLHGDFLLPSRADLEEASGFPLPSKIRKDEKFSEEPLHSDMNGSCVVVNPYEAQGESFARSCGDSVAATSRQGAVDSHFFSEGEDQHQGTRVEVRNTENQKEGAKLDAHFFHGAQQNHSVHHWLDNCFRHHGALPFPPMGGHGLTDGVPTNPLTYWQFIQASAVNYAAYTAAMAAAAAAAGWSGSIAGREESTEFSQANVIENQIFSSFGSDLTPTALPSAASWWPLRGFMPPGYSPMGAMHQGESVVTAASAHPLEHGKEDAAQEHTSLQGGENAMNLGTAGELQTSNLNGNCGRKPPENSPSAKTGCTQGTLNGTEVLISESVLPDSESQHEMDGTIMPAKYTTQESDTERRVAIESPENLYSSSDEFNAEVKKQREGSSSGSNTPVSRCQLSECDTQAILENKKKDSYTLFEDNDDICSDAFKKSHQLCGITTMESPKARAKHTDKGRKHQQKDFKRGSSDDSKRFKSCTHEIELRKAVSQEGRKAFQALFSSKLLPQTFPAAARMVEGRDTYRNELVSRPIVSMESDSIYVPAPIEIASGECIYPDGSLQEERTGEVHVCGNVSSNTNSDLETGFGCGVTKERHEENKSFTISSSSGFLPYKRPLFTEPKIPEQPTPF